MEYQTEARRILLQAAKDSIVYGLEHHSVMPIDLNSFPKQLQEARACFVTLHKQGNLRGCIGSLIARQPLILDVVANAFNSAFHDPRFPGVQAAEIPLLSVDISILTKPILLQVDSEEDLYKKLRPGIDGLILSDQGHRATFLPSVWDQLPDPTSFVTHLKNKAGWPSNYWSKTMVVEVYSAELISNP